MWQFFKYVLATMLGLFLFGILSLFLLLGIGAAISAASDGETTVAENSILKLDLNKPISETVNEDNPFADLGGPFEDTQGVGLLQVKNALANAKLDPNIKGIYLKAGTPMAGYATMQEIRNALLDFKKSGKFVYTYGEVFSEKGYYLSSVADKFFLNPAGGVEFNGLSAEYDFYKGTLDKLNIEPMIFRVGSYKSAVEPFFRESMSDSSKLQTRSFLTSIHNTLLADIATSRGLTVARLNGLADSLAIDSPQDALNAKLVTDLGYFDQFEAELKKKVKIDADKKLKFVSLDKYLKAPKQVKEGPMDTRIAVIVADGTIIDGEGSNGQVGSETTAAEIRKARLDKKIKAIVLRVNSPGGSALASDVMWREVTLAKQAKPVIASMSDYAASGGYYLAMGASKIVAQPTTLTGSIGVFGVLFRLDPFLREKLGITFDRVGTNAHADWPTLTREMTAFEKARIQGSVDKIYATFTTKAAQGRKMDVAKLRALAGGRVWSGTEARQVGLVDELGGLDRAIQLAAQEAKLKEGEYRLKLPPKKSFWQELMDNTEDEYEARALESTFGAATTYVRQLRDLQHLEGIQARMPGVRVE
jgi:protease-4